MAKNCKTCGTLTERKYCSSECYRTSENEAGRRRSAKFSPQRRRAAVLIQSAFQRGELTQQPCEVCAAADTVAHHDDYAAPLDVRWLCRSCHKKHHHQHGPGKNAFAEHTA